jgi:hypothetical protein
MVCLIVPEEHTMFGFVPDPQLEKANPGLEFLVGLPKMHKMAAQSNLILGDAEWNPVLRHEDFPPCDSTKPRRFSPDCLFP